MNKSIEVQKLAERIKSLRVEKGYTSYENFAFDKDIPRTQYGRYEKGTDLQFTSLLKIAKAFDMTLEEFFSEGFD
ncbi:MAG: helix-turn-helix transcriptional regulator [Bacteroidota bacterium]